MSTIAIAGCRTFVDYKLFSSFMDKIAVPGDSIVTGDSAGTDSMALQYAQQHKMKFRIYRADWENYGKAAGPIRNKDLVHFCDKVVIFWDQKSPGTKTTLDLAKTANKRIIEIDISKPCPTMTDTPILKFRPSSDIP